MNNYRNKCIERDGCWNYWKTIKGKLKQNHRIELFKFSTRAAVAYFSLARIKAYRFALKIRINPLSAVLFIRIYTFLEN